MKSTIETILEEFLNERFLNITKSEEKKQYLDDVWDMIELSYAYIGGPKGATKENLIEASGLWKLVRKDGKIVASAIYKKTPYNEYEDRKGMYYATDGSSLGKQWLKKIIEEDALGNRVWGEVSGKLAGLLQKYGFKFQPNEYAKLLMPNKDIELDSDGIHYYRKLNNSDKKVKKALIGNVERALRLREKS